MAHLCVPQRHQLIRRSCDLKRVEAGVANGSGSDKEAASGEQRFAIVGFGAARALEVDARELATRPGALGCG